MKVTIYNHMLDIRNDENYHNEVHCIECSNGFIGTTGWHKPVNKVIADIYNGDVTIEDNPLGHNLHIVTETDNYYAKTKTYENELEFTLINCEGNEIRKEYRTVEDFVKEMRSDNPDIPMLDDRIKDMILWNVPFIIDWDISVLCDYLGPYF